MAFNQLYTMIILAVSDEVVQASNASEMSNIIGVGGIIATIIVGVVTCIVTWKLTKLSIKQKRLSYGIKVLNILSTKIQGQYDVWDNLVITYGNRKLDDPCLLMLEIENSGNTAIIAPPICVKVDGNVELIPGNFQDVPAGYEEKWKMQQLSNDSCAVHLEHINPKQNVKAYFFLNSAPQKVIFECPMPDINVQEKSDYEKNQQTNFKGHFGRKEKVTCVLLIFTVLLLISTDLWIEFLHAIEWYRWLPAPAICVVWFILVTLIVSIALNILGVKRLDDFLINQVHVRKWVILCLSVLVVLFLGMILYNILITNFYMQIIIAAVIIILLSLIIHMMSLDLYKV